MEYKEPKDKNEISEAIPNTEAEAVFLYGKPRAGAAELSKKVRNSLPPDKKGPNGFYDPNR